MWKIFSPSVCKNLPVESGRNSDEQQYSLLSDSVGKQRELGLHKQTWPIKISNIYKINTVKYNTKYTIKLKLFLNLYLNARCFSKTFNFYSIVAIKKVKNAGQLWQFRVQPCVTLRL